MRRVMRFLVAPVDIPMWFAIFIAATALLNIVTSDVDWWTAILFSALGVALLVLTYRVRRAVDDE